MISAAEHTVALLLALARNVPQAHAALREGRWERSRFGGIELAGKTLGIVGFGRIGQQVARRARALEMRVVGYDPYVAPDRFRALGAEHTSDLTALLGQSDFLTLHLTLTEETRGLLGRAELAAAKPGIRVVNVAGGARRRGGAGRRARDGTVAGAALDVFSAEPYSGPLLELPNVVVTPHLGASTEEARGPCRRDRGRAGLRRARGKGRHERGQHAGGRPRGARAPQALPAARREARHWPSSSRAGTRRGSISSTWARSEEDTRLLTVAALNGVFHGRVENINYVNAPLVAAERGLEVREESSSHYPTSRASSP